MNAPAQTSKKQSDAGYGKKPLDSITFLVDRRLGKYKVPERLTQKKNELTGIEINVKRLDDFFDQSTRDEEWLKFAGNKSWVVLTKDSHIRYRKSEEKMVKKYDVRIFTLARGNWTGDQNAEILDGALKSICGFLEKNPAPFIASISKSGNIRKIDLSD